MNIDDHGFIYSETRTLGFGGIMKGKMLLAKELTYLNGKIIQMIQSPRVWTKCRVKAY